MIAAGLSALSFVYGCPGVVSLTSSQNRIEEGTYEGSATCSIVVENGETFETPFLGIPFDRTISRNGLPITEGIEAFVGALAPVTVVDAVGTGRYTSVEITPNGYETIVEVGFDLGIRQETVSTESCFQKPTDPNYISCTIEMNMQSYQGGTFFESRGNCLASGVRR